MRCVDKYLLFLLNVETVDYIVIEIVSREAA